MKKFTFLTTLIICLFSISSFAQDPVDLPFFDDFSNGYQHWTHYSLAGDDQWHLSYDDGIDGSTCARFYITSNPPQANNDWLVSETFNTEGISNVAIEFKYLYHDNGLIPEFYYTSSFTGDIGSTEWTWIDNSFWENEWTWNDARIELESPGETLVFAVRYQSTPSASIYVLIDNFSIESFEPVNFEKVGETDHFEYYTSFSDSTDYWLDIENKLEDSYHKYCGLWNIPGLTDFMDDGVKTKVYYTVKENIIYVDEGTPEWKAGFFDRETKSVYLSPLNTEDKAHYYGDIEGLAVHTFAGYALKNRLYRDRDGYDYSPDYFTEAFGLYETGYRPERDSIISFRASHPDEISHNDLDGFNNINSTSEKDVAVSYVEGQLLVSLGYRGCEAPYSSYIPIWNKFLIHFYDTTDAVQIKKYGESTNFDVYCSTRDTTYIDSMLVWLERTRQYYVDSFQMDIYNRYPLIVLYDEQTGIDLTGYDNFNGGAGGLNISPHNFFGGIEGYPWLLGHEFGHVFNNLMYYDFPFGFYHEGMANFSGYNVAGGEHEDDIWKIDYVFDYYQEKYGREPTLEEFITNPDADDPNFYGIDCYYFGFEFMRFLKNHEGFLKIKEFFNNGLDFDVFDMTYDEIEQGYIDYLKHINETHSVLEFGENSGQLLNIYPNPLTPASVITFQTQTNGHVNLTIYDISGREVYSVLDKDLKKGEHQIRFGDHRLQCGIYLCRLTSPAGVSSFKFIVK